MRKILWGLVLLLGCGFGLEPSAASVAPADTAVRMLGAQLKPGLQQAFLGGLTRKAKKAVRSGIARR